jgi:hypothetical protein
MAHDNARAVPQPVLERAAHDIALPAPRAPVLDTAAHDVARPAPEPAALEMAQPAPRLVHGAGAGPGAGWILSAVIAAAAAWTVGWVAGVSWAWRAMTPRYLRRTHRRRGAGLAAAGSPLRS